MGNQIYRKQVVHLDREIPDWERCWLFARKEKKKAKEKQKQWNSNECKTEKDNADWPAEFYRYIWDYMIFVEVGDHQTTKSLALQTKTLQWMSCTLKPSLFCLGSFRNLRAFVEPHLGLFLRKGKDSCGWFIRVSTICDLESWNLGPKNVLFFFEKLFSTLAPRAPITHNIKLKLIVERYT